MKGEYFCRIIKHYMIVALKQAGASVNSDTYAELNAACEDLMGALEKPLGEVVGFETGVKDTGVSRQRVSFGTDLDCS